MNTKDEIFGTVFGLNPDIHDITQEIQINKRVSIEREKNGKKEKSEILKQASFSTMDSNKQYKSKDQIRKRKKVLKFQPRNKRERTRTYLIRNPKDRKREWRRFLDAAKWGYLWIEIMGILGKKRGAFLEYNGPLI